MSYFKSCKKGVITVLVVLMTVGSAWAGAAAKKTRGSALQILPARTLFCVKVRNPDSTCTAVNEYLKGVAPESFDAKDEVLSGLAEMLGGKKPRGVNVKGTFAIFGVNLPSKEAPVNPFDNLFVGGLVQVRNYDNFVSRNPNVGEADDEGISTITVDGHEEAVVTRKGRFAIMCPTKSRDKLIRFKKMRAGKKRGLDALLDESEKELLRASPIWLYGNVQQGSKLFAPMVFGQLEALKVILKQAQEQGKAGMADPVAAIDFYSKIIEMTIKGTDHLAIGIAPTAEKCRFTLQAKAVDGTLLSELLAAPEDGDLGGLLGYLDDGAFANVVTKVDRKSMKLGYMKMIDLLASISPDAMGQAETEKLKKLTDKSIHAMGDCLAISMKSGGEKDEPFSFKYVIQVRDEDAFKEIIEEELEMIDEGMFDKLYKGFGLEIGTEVEREAATYRGVEIGSAKLSFKMGEEDSPESEMLNKIWGDGMEYRWAVLDGYCVYAFGGDTEKIVRKLIDQVKAGGPDELASEIKTAIAVFEGDGEEEEYDFGGTVNFVRLLNMMSGFIAALGGPQIKPLDMPTKSNLVFAGRSGEGKLLAEGVMPKQHLLEVKAAGEKFGEEMEKGVKEQKKEKEKKEAEESSGSDDVR